MSNDAQQWSGAALAIVAVVGLTVLLVVHPTIISSEAVVGLYVALGLRATGLVAHVLNKPRGGEDDAKRS